jgi:hypothetical protein
MASGATAPMGRHHPNCDGKIVVAAFLGQVGRRQIDGDALRREREPNGVQRPAHPFAAFGHRLVRQADNGESGHAGTDLDLHVHAAGFDAFKGDRGDPREHDETPRFRPPASLAKARRARKNNKGTFLRPADSQRGSRTTHRATPNRRYRNP